MHQISEEQTKKKNIVTINDLIEMKINPSDVTDEQIIDLAYGIKYFSFYGYVSDEDISYWRETRKILIDRLDAIEKAKGARKRITLPKRTLTQLWEPCEGCGAEPCYLELGHRCKICG